MVQAAEEGSSFIRKLFHKKTPPNRKASPATVFPLLDSLKHPPNLISPKSRRMKLHGAVHTNSPTGPNRWHSLIFRWCQIIQVDLIENAGERPRHAQNLRFFPVKNGGIADLEVLGGKSFDSLLWWRPLHSNEGLSNCCEVSKSRPSSARQLSCLTSQFPPPSSCGAWDGLRCKGLGSTETDVDQHMRKHWVGWQNQCHQGAHLAGNISKYARFLWKKSARKVWSLKTSMMYCEGKLM